MNKKLKTVSSDIIVEQYSKLYDLVMKHADDANKEPLKNLFNDFEERIVSAPASGRLNYHNCFVGGFVDHVLRVQETALKVKQLLETMNVEVKASDSEVFFAAVFHDWGKLGTLKQPYYIQEKSSWHQEKLGQYWKHNDKLDYMSVTDRSLFTLQSYNIKVSNQVWKAIKLSDGMFDDGNVGYFKRPTESDNILHYIIHWADWMSTVVEKTSWIQEVPQVDPKLQNLKSQFDDMFPKD